MSDLEKFLEERSRVPIPSGKVQRTKFLAKELAMGVPELWKTKFLVSSSDEIGGELITLDNNLDSYFMIRWEDKHIGRHLELLKVYGFIGTVNGGREILKAAFDLLGESEPYNIFISYKRSESSLLALLVNNTLKLNGLVPFFDMFLKPTDEWHARLESQVKASQYFVVLMGTYTHRSKYTVREINWAIAHNVPVIQIWSHGYTISPTDWEGTEFPDVAGELERRQAITINTDDAEGYHLAMEKLVNAVGVIV